MVAADIDTSSCVVGSSIANSPKWRNTATNSVSIGAKRPGLQRCTQRLAGMTTVPPGVGAQLVKDHALAVLSRPLIASRGRLSDCSALCQCQPHLLGVRAHFQ